MGEFTLSRRTALTTRRGRACPVAGISKQQQTSLTTFVRHDSGEWIYGPEAPATFRLQTRSFYRKEIGAAKLRVVDYFRYEIVVALNDAANFGVERGNTVVIADLPLGQRRFQATRIQGYGKSSDSFIFEELENLGLTGDQLAKQSDHIAIDILHRTQTNLFSSERTLSCAIAALEAGPFVPYDDLDSDILYIPTSEREGYLAARRTREEIAPNSRSDGSYAFGVVRNIDQIRADLYLQPLLRRALEQIGEGTYRLPIPGHGNIIKVPLELAASAVAHFELAIFQALAGAGHMSAKWFDRPVSRYVHDLLTRHLVRAIDRFKPRLIPPDVLRNFELPYEDDAPDTGASSDGRHTG